MRQTLARILEIEETAIQIREKAQEEAAAIIAETEAEMQALRSRVVSDAQTEADWIIARGREAAEAARAQVLAEAGATAQHLETLSTKHRAQTVEFILNQVAGRAQ